MEDLGEPIASGNEARPFHLIKRKYGDQSLERAIRSSRITEEDASLIQEYVSELQSTRNLGLGRVNKITYALVNWRKYLGPYTENSLADLYRGIARIKGATIQGRPYKQNTLRDYLIFLKRFYLWLVESGYSSVPKEKVQRIQAPPPDTMTKLPSQLLTEEEVLAMVRNCRSSRDRALVATLYEGGFRIKELGTLSWEQVKFDSYGVVINVNIKTGRPRYIRLVASAPYLATWKMDYPYRPEGESLVFLTTHHQPLQHAGVATQLRKIALRAGITKHITPHLFRHSRITHLLQQGYSESIIKMMMWGHMNTEMLTTYAHLTSFDIDREVLGKMGIATNPQESNGAFEPRQCIHCHSINPPTANYCSTCGVGLTTEAVEAVDEAMKAIEATEEFQAVMALVKETLRSRTLHKGH